MKGHFDVRHCPRADCSNVQIDTAPRDCPNILPYSLTSWPDRIFHHVFTALDGRKDTSARAIAAHCQAVQWRFSDDGLFFPGTVDSLNLWDPATIEKGMISIEGHPQPLTLVCGPASDSMEKLYLFFHSVSLGSSRRKAAFRCRIGDSQGPGSALNGADALHLCVSVEEAFPQESRKAIGDRVKNISDILLAAPNEGIWVVAVHEEALWGRLGLDDDITGRLAKKSIQEFKEALEKYCLDTLNLRPLLSPLIDRFGEQAFSFGLSPRYPTNSQSVLGLHEWATSRFRYSP